MIWIFQISLLIGVFLMLLYFAVVDQELLQRILGYQGGVAGKYEFVGIIGPLNSHGLLNHDRLVQSDIEEIVNNGRLLLNHPLKRLQHHFGQAIFFKWLRRQKRNHQIKGLWPLLFQCQVQGGFPLLIRIQNGKRHYDVFWREFFIFLSLVIFIMN